MREIDCSNLPDELADVALTAAEEYIEQKDCETNGVKILRHSNLVVLNGDGRQIKRLFGGLQQAMGSSVQESLHENHTMYSEEERLEYRHGLEFRKV